jgi:hypothetical protein
LSRGGYLLDGYIGIKHDCADVKSIVFHVYNIS